MCGSILITLHHKIALNICISNKLHKKVENHTKHDRNCVMTVQYSGD